MGESGVGWRAGVGGGCAVDGGGVGAGEGAGCGELEVGVGFWEGGGFGGVGSFCWAAIQAGRLSMRGRLRRMDLGGGFGGGAGGASAAGAAVEVVWVVGGVAEGLFRVIGKEVLSLRARKVRAAASRRPPVARMKGQPTMESTETSSPRAKLM